MRTTRKWLATAAVLAAALVAGCIGGRLVRNAVAAPGGAANPVAAPGGAANPVAAPGAGPAGVRAPLSPEPARTSARPPVNHCAGNAAAQLVLVSISAQHAWLCERSAAVYETAVTTGMARPGDGTPTGHFRIQARNRNSVLNLNGRSYPVRYWIPFDAPMYGFHDASWQTIAYGSPQYRTGGSHGCVHLPLKALAFLYGWVRVGAAVTITS
jgi:hypothetical protein